MEPICWIVTAAVAVAASARDPQPINTCRLLVIFAAHYLLDHSDQLKGLVAFATCAEGARLTS
jgi:hypothetical protein